jgi:hypothetical protein
MLRVNEHLDKLSAMHSDSIAYRMMPDGHHPLAGTSSLLHHLNDHPLINGNQDESNDENEGPIDDNVLGHIVLARSCGKYCPAQCYLCVLETNLLFILEINYPQNLQELAAKINEPDLPLLVQRFLTNQLHLTGKGMPLITSKVDVFCSAIAMFFTPSDPSGICDMQCECI